MMNNRDRKNLSESNNIYIKNMVCNRCIMVVGQIFKSGGVEDVNVQIGKVEVEHNISDSVIQEIEADLNKVGFEIMSSQAIRLVEQIKNHTINFVYNVQEYERKVNFSTLLSSKMNKEYNYLSSLFSSVENITIERYLINLKIERVKELLVYDEKTLSEIAYEMGYSSVAHLSGQFKKNAGFTPSYYKNLGNHKRKSIDNV